MALKLFDRHIDAVIASYLGRKDNRCFRLSSAWLSSGCLGSLWLGSASFGAGWSRTDRLSAASFASIRSARRNSARFIGFFYLVQSISVCFGPAWFGLVLVCPARMGLLAQGWPVSTQLVTHRINLPQAESGWLGPDRNELSQLVSDKLTRTEPTRFGPASTKPNRTEPSEAVPSSVWIWIINEPDNSQPGRLRSVGHNGVSQHRETQYMDTLHSLLLRINEQTVWEIMPLTVSPFCKWLETHPVHRQLIDVDDQWFDAKSKWSLGPLQWFHSM